MNFATLEYSHSGDATKRLRGCIISRRFLCHTIYYSIVLYGICPRRRYMLLDVGRLALYIV